MQPIAEWYKDNAGYRKLGLRYEKSTGLRDVISRPARDIEEDVDTIGTCRADDLIPEENEVVQLALKRLSPKEAYDRVYRMRRAFQVYIHHLHREQPVEVPDRH